MVKEGCATCQMIAPLAAELDQHGLLNGRGGCDDESAAPVQRGRPRRAVADTHSTRVFGAADVYVSGNWRPGGEEAGPTEQEIEIQLQAGASWRRRQDTSASSHFATVARSPSGM